MRVHRRLYVGYVEGVAREIFRAAPTPSELSHGDKYRAVVGPFRTLAAARFMLAYGWNNPHCRSVDEAERLAKENRQ